MLGIRVCWNDMACYNGHTHGGIIMKFVVIGINGAIGQRFAQKALATGHHVIGYARGEKSDHISHPNLTYVYGDLRDLQMLERLVVEADIIVSTLGPKLKSKHSDKTTPIANAHHAILKLMHVHGKKRLITIGTPSASSPSDPNTWFFKMDHWIAKHFMPQAFLEMKQLSHVLHHSNLDWTLIRFGRLTDQETSDYTLASGSEAMKDRVSRDGVAQALLDVSLQDTHLKNSPIVFTP